MKFDIPGVHVYARLCASECTDKCKGRRYCSWYSGLLLVRRGWVDVGVAADPVGARGWEREGAGRGERMGRAPCTS